MTSSDGPRPPLSILLCCLLMLICLVNKLLLFFFFLHKFRKTVVSLQRCVTHNIARINFITFRVVDIIWTLKNPSTTPRVNAIYRVSQKVSPPCRLFERVMNVLLLCTQYITGSCMLAHKFGIQGNNKAEIINVKNLKNESYRQYS